MKVYTRTGDAGTTSLVGGTRVAKNAPRLNAYGTVDELNSWLGVLASHPEVGEEHRQMLQTIQNTLFDLGAELATEADSKWQPRKITQAAIDNIETAIDALEARLPHHNRFILPGGSQAASFAHVARTVARRAERLIVTLAETAEISPLTLRYINRLSDYLFVLARAINIDNQKPEIFWAQD